MKITNLDVTALNNRGLLLQMRTDEGLTGLGAPMNYEHGRTVERAIHDMGDYLIGRDPLQIEDHWQTLFRSSYSRQMPILLAALSGIEMACLDILGKTAGCRCGNCWVDRCGIEYACTGRLGAPRRKTRLSMHACVWKKGSRRSKRPHSRIRCARSRHRLELIAPCL